MVKGRSVLPTAPMNRMRTGTERLYYIKNERMKLYYENDVKIALCFTVSLRSLSVM